MRCMQTNSRSFQKKSRRHVKYASKRQQCVELENVRGHIRIKFNFHSIFHNSTAEFIEKLHAAICKEHCNPPIPDQLQLIIVCWIHSIWWKLADILESRKLDQKISLVRLHYSYEFSRTHTPAISLALRQRVRSNAFFASSFARRLRVCLNTSCANWTEIFLDA